MADVEITYKGNKIVELSEDGTKVLKTSGKYCEDDITVDYVQPQGIIPSGSLPISENGTYDVANYAEAEVNVPMITAYWESVISLNNLSLSFFENIPYANTRNCTNFAGAFKRSATYTKVPQGSGALASLRTIKLNISSATTLENAFMEDDHLMEVEFVDDSENAHITNMNNCFYYCNHLEKIIGTPLNLENCTNLNNNTFFNCLSLKEIRIKPNTLKVNLKLSYSNLLSKDSVLSLINALNTVNVGTIYLHSDTKGYMDDWKCKYNESTGLYEDSEDAGAPSYTSAVSEKGWILG